MSFDLAAWLRTQVGDNSFDVPVIDVSSTHPDDRREFLVTNGLGSYASANIHGANTRRYHGLLVAALDPPVRRTVIFSRLDEFVTVSGEETSLATNFWRSGTVSPSGYKSLKAFAHLPVPTWVFAVSGGLIIKQIAMLQDKQQVAIGYTWITPDEPKRKKTAKLALNAILNFRDFHSETKGFDPWQFEQIVESGKVTIKAFDTAQPMTLHFDCGTYESEPKWYYDYHWPLEQERGLNDHEDCFHAGVLTVSLKPGQSVTIVGALDEVELNSINEFVRSVWSFKSQLLKSAGSPVSLHEKLLVLAANDFVVKRFSTNGHSIIAGYHWFGDWGRDSMISLPGLTLATGRPEIARSILSTFGRYLSEGMLPNYFPDSGQSPEYNTADATFFWAYALLRYHNETNDTDFLRAQLPLLDSVVEWHQKGTRHGLHIDPVDGLISGGDSSVQLTWMDAKVGDYVVTPRTGKCVEINALWYNFLKTLEFFHCVIGSYAFEETHAPGPIMSAARRKADSYAAMSAKVKNSFTKFWNEERGCLYDLICADGTRDGSIRPNQLFAGSLTYPVISREQTALMLKVVETELLTPKVLRTLSPLDPSYKGQYGNGKKEATQFDRDITYHQGTAWAWLFGPWVNCRVYAHGVKAANFVFIAQHLKPILKHILNEGCVGSVSEIFDGDFPFGACGCIAQAWSVAEIVRVLHDFPQISSSVKVKDLATSVR